MSAGGRHRARPDRDETRTLVRAAGAELDDERLEAVVELLVAVAGDLDAFDELDLDSVEPEIVFHAAWP